MQLWASAFASPQLQNGIIVPTGSWVISEEELGRWNLGIIMGVHGEASCNRATAIAHCALKCLVYGAMEPQLGEKRFSFFN